MIFELWIRATLLIGVISKSLNLGNGKTLPGKLILKLYPNAIEKLFQEAKLLLNKKKATNETNLNV